MSNDHWAGDALVLWRFRKHRGRHARAHLPSSYSTMPMWAPALLGMVLLLALVLLLLTYV